MPGIQTETALVVDVWSDYAHFRKPYTTSSPLTFAFPPRTALAGLIAAFAGLGKEEYLEHFACDRARLAVALCPQGKAGGKTRIPENLIDTKASGSYKMNKIRNRTQINLEVVYAPRYRIFVQHMEPDIMAILRRNLSRHESVYTPYLGISEFIAGFAFVGEFACSPLENIVEPVSLATVLPLESILPGSIVFEPGEADGNEYFRERVPGEMKPERITTTYDEVLYERHGHLIRAIPKEGAAASVALPDPVAVVWL